MKIVGLAFFDGEKKNFLRDFEIGLKFFWFFFQPQIEFCTKKKHLPKKS